MVYTQTKYEEKKKDPMCLKSKLLYQKNKKSPICCKFEIFYHDPQLDIKF